MKCLGEVGPESLANCGGGETAAGGEQQGDTGEALP
jgi:hypothetical protein